MNKFNNCDPVVLNIKFWIINKPDGTNEYTDVENNVLQGLANLNILYNEYGIIFKYRGYEHFNSPVTYWGDVDNDGEPDLDPNGFYNLENGGDSLGTITNYATNNGYNMTNAFNVYVFHGAPYGGSAFRPGLNCAVKFSRLTFETLSHELGHNLSFHHTRSTSEHATRDVNDPNFNADYAGDKVVDTAANKGFYDSTCQCYPNIADCEYTGNETDNVGDSYVISPQDVINLMGNAYECIQPVITPGQGIRAREQIESGYYDNALTTLASLYEPYAGDYYVIGPLPPNYKPPRFQPGFNYRFVPCCCDYPEPSDYSDTSFSWTHNTIFGVSKYETDFASIVHPNHSAILIDLPRCTGQTNFPRRCYDNNNRWAKDGSVTKFNDGVLNANVTITPKDSLAINNEYLIDNLPAGLYKIEKNYHDGSTHETVIQKQND